MATGTKTENEPGRDQVIDETVALLHALRSVLDQETADRLFPQAWRHLRRIRSRQTTGKRHIQLPSHNYPDPSSAKLQRG